MRLEPVQLGDIVDIVAPASRCSALDLKRGLQSIRQAGLVPRVPENLFAPSILFANSDSQRLAQLKRAFYARDSKLIWCVRGGYGSLRLVPEMQRWSRPKMAKILLGYSDVTSLHAFVNQAWKWPSLHGPMVDRFGRETTPEFEKRELLDILFGRLNEVEFAGLKPLNAAARVVRVLHAPGIIGGNMAVLQSGLGTKSALRPKGRILFFEDTGERPHRVDRMLSQMEQAGWFKGARALVFGNFLLSESKDRRQLWSDVMPRFAKAQSIPVLAGLPVGHDPQLQRTLPFGTPVLLKLGVNARLTVQSGLLFKDLYDEA